MLLAFGVVLVESPSLGIGEGRFLEVSSIGLGRILSYVDVVLAMCMQAFWRVLVESLACGQGRAASQR